MNEWIELNWIHTVRVRCAYKIDERRRYLLSVEIEENILHGENGCSASNGERAYAIYSMCLKGVWSHSQSIRDKNKLLHSYVYSTHIALSLLDSGNAITLTLSTQQKKKKKKKRKSIRAVSIMNNRNWLNRCKIKKKHSIKRNSDCPLYLRQSAYCMSFADDSNWLKWNTCICKRKRLKF